jgi:hypothetical protein
MRRGDDLVMFEAQNVKPGLTDSTAPPDRLSEDSDESHASCRIRRAWR